MEGITGMEEKLPARLNRSDGRRFAFTVGVALLSLSVVARFRQHSLLFAAFSLPGALLFLAGWIVPTRLSPIWRLWMGMAHAISRVTAPIAMSAVYFLALTPIGTVKRVAGRNALSRPKDARGYWVRRDSGQEARSDLERQF